MNYDEKTKLGKILDEHPWLEQELPKRYSQLKSMDNPASRFMARRMTVKDAKTKEVDGRTGATYSSDAVKKNVKLAVEYYEKNK